MNGTTLKEKYITSVSKSFNGQSFYSLGQNATIIVNRYMVAGTSYQLKVQGREWAKYNANNGFFGRTTNIYVGANGVSTAQYGTMTVTFVSE